MEKRICPFCGRSIAAFLVRCPECREAIPNDSHSGAKSQPRASSSEGSASIRRGLLWSLLASVAYYFASPNSTYTLPFSVPAIVTQALLPLAFLAGLAMAVYGLFIKMRS